MKAFNIKYLITGLEDGRWMVEAYDRLHRPIGHTILVSTPDEAWKIFMALNGYSYETVKTLNGFNESEGAA